jgi:hypothetical protein
MENFYKNFVSIFEAIHLCLDNKLILPALMLIYTAIDIVGGLERKKGEGTKASFIRFVDGYLLITKQLECTALELYAARCGILHAAAAESDLYKKGDVRLVIYAWGTAKVEDIKKAGEKIERHDTVAVHISDLIDAFKIGLAHYLEDVYKDPIRVNVVETNAAKVFSHMPNTIVEEFLKLGKES